MNLILSVYFIEHKISKCYHTNRYQYKSNNEIVTFLFFIVPSKYSASFGSHSTAKIGLVKCSLGLLWLLSWWAAQLKMEGAASTEPGEFPSPWGPRGRNFKLWTSYVPRSKGINGGKISSRCIRDAFECQSVALYLIREVSRQTGC